MATTAKRNPPAKRVIKAKLIEIEVIGSSSDFSLGIVSELISLASRGHDHAKIKFPGVVGTLKVTR